MEYRFSNNQEIMLYHDAEAGRWYIRNISMGTNYDLLSKNLSPFLKLFMEDPDAFFSNVQDEIKKRKLDETAVNALPLKASIKFCIDNKMSYWLELSLKWFEFIEIDDELYGIIKSAVTDTAFPQSLRHKLRQAIHRKV